MGLGFRVSGLEALGFGFGASGLAWESPKKRRGWAFRLLNEFYEQAAMACCVLRLERVATGFRRFWWCFRRV